MTRRFLDDIKADIATLMEDNTTGDFLLAQDRQLRIDMIDSTINDECVLLASTPVASIPTTVGWTILGTGVYDTATGGDATFLKANLVAGTIVSNTTPGFTYSAEGFVSFEGANNAAYEFAIGRNGTPSLLVTKTTGSGPGDPSNAYFQALDLSALADTSFSIMCRTPDGVNTMDLAQCYFVLTVKPTSNP